MSQKAASPTSPSSIPRPWHAARRTRNLSHYSIGIPFVVGERRAGRRPRRDHRGATGPADPADRALPPIEGAIRADSMTPRTSDDDGVTLGPREPDLGLLGIGVERAARREFGRLKRRTRSRSASKSPVANHSRTPLPREGVARIAHDAGDGRRPKRATAPPSGRPTSASRTRCRHGRTSRPSTSWNQREAAATSVTASMGWGSITDEILRCSTRVTRRPRRPSRTRARLLSSVVVEPSP